VLCSVEEGVVLYDASRVGKGNYSYEQISWEGTQIIPPFLNVLIAAKSIWMDLSNVNVKIWRVKGL